MSRIRYAAFTQRTNSYISILVMKIKKNDTVTVIAGKDKGATGTVSKVLPDEGKVIVSGVNVKTHHRRGSKQEAGQKLEKEAPIDVSNVALVDPDTGRPTRAGYQVDEKGAKKRVSKKSGKEV